MKLIIDRLLRQRNGLMIYNKIERVLGVCARRFSSPRGMRHRCTVIGTRYWVTGNEVRAEISTRARVPSGADREEPQRLNS